MEELVFWLPTSAAILVVIGYIYAFVSGIWWGR